MAGTVLSRTLKAVRQAFDVKTAGRCSESECAGDRRLSAVLSAAPTIVYAATPTDPHAITFISANIRDETGYPREDLLRDGTLWARLIHPQDHDRRLAVLARLQESGKASVDYRYRHGDGEWHWIRDRMRCLRDEDGTVLEVVGSLSDITEHRASQEALATSEEKLITTQRLLADALESSEDAFSLFDADDRLVVFNRRYQAMYPLISDLIRPGVRFEDLLRQSAKRGQYMDVRAETVEQWVQERLDRHRRAAGVFEQRLADGRCLEIVERRTTEGGRVAIRRDVTARKQIEEALRRELTFEQTMLDALPFPVFFKGCNGRFLGCNAKMSEVTGRPLADIVGRTLHELLPPEKADEYDRIDREILSTPGVKNHELTVQWADGSFRRINLVSGTFNGADGQIAGFIGSVIDITERKRAEEQLVQAAKLATLGQIASEVAHELNQPLSIIRMSAESALSEVRNSTSTPEQVEQKLSIIVRQVSRMAEMVDHLRSFSRLEHGEKRPFSLPQVARAAASFLVPQFQLDGIALHMGLDENCPEILGRANQIEQVVLNLLANARDAVRDAQPPGAGQVSMNLHVDGPWAHLSISDNGGGIPDKVLGSIFEPFFTTKSEGAGTGLGLSISENIISGMGGSIEAKNHERGALFIVRLPLHEGAKACPPPCAARDAQPVAPVVRGCVLVVDDEALAVECIADYLTARGFQVVTATGPAKALEMARQHDVDLLVSDMRMPGMDGCTLLERLRRERPAMPAVLMTGGPVPDVPLAGGIRTMGKPLALDELLVHVSDLLIEEAKPCPA